MRLKSRLAFYAAFTALIGCGGGDDAIRDVRGNPNDFAGGQNPVNDFSSASTGDSSNSNGLAANEVRITMEVPGGVAPDAELTRRNLRIVQPDRVQVYTTNTSLQNLGQFRYPCAPMTMALPLLALTEGSTSVPMSSLRPVTTTL